MDIIFDIGNVICSWNPQKIVSGIFPDPEEQSQALNCVFKHDDWLTLDKGLMELDEAIINAQRRSSLDPVKIKSLYVNTPASLTPIPHVTQTISELSKKGYRLFVLSNMQKHAWEYLESHYDFWSCFTGIVLSFGIRLIKPDPKIFDYIIDKYKLVPSQTIFLDDLKDNISTAQSMGINTIHVENTDNSLNQLKQRLGM